jgi:tetratricopeptide (TPR) repeat protein
VVIRRALWLPPLAAAIVALPALHAGFVHDDHLQIVGNPLLRDVRRIPALWLGNVWAGAGSGSSWYRPVMTTSFALDRALFGLDATAMHAVSLLLWSAVAGLAAHLVLAVERRGGLALGAGLLFAVHPLNVEPTAWISARCSLLAAGFGLLALLLHDRVLLERSRALALRSASGVAFALALFASESAVAFAPALLALDAVRGAPFRPRAALQRWLPPLLALVLYAGMRSRVLGGVSGGVAGAVEPALILAAFGDAALRIVWPEGLSIAAAPPSPGEAVLGAVVVVLGLLALGVAARRRSPSLLPLALGGAHLLVAALAAARLGALADRYLLMPVLAAAWLVAAGVAGLAPALRRVAVASAACLAVLLGVLAFRHAGVFVSDERLWSDGWSKNPASVQAALNLAALRLDAGEPREALLWLDRAAALDPRDAQVRVNRAVAWEQLGRPEEARRLLLEVVAESPRAADAQLRLGHLALAQGDPAAAARHYEAVLGAAPWAEAWAGLGLARRRLGDAAGARDALERALLLDPGQENAAELRRVLDSLP